MKAGILVVDDEDSIRQSVTSLLADEGYAIDNAEDAESALVLFNKNEYGVVITDIHMGQKSGLELLSDMKKINPHVHIIVITGYASMDSAIAVLKAGAYDYLIKPFDIELLLKAAERAMDNYILTSEKDDLLDQLKRKNHELQLANTKLAELVVLDGLTGIYNHRYLQESLNKEVSRALRYNRDLSIIFLDIDYFKNYNDTNGHQAGDLVLKSFAEILVNSVRRVDICARYGGEEFMILLPETSKEKALLVTEKLRSQIETFPFKNRETQPGEKVTASIGVASYGLDGGTGAELIESADKALYRAKDQGRNRVCS